MSKNECGEILAAYGFDETVTGLKVKCKCGAVFTTGFLAEGKVFSCPHCNRKYRFIIDFKLEEVKVDE